MISHLRSPRLRLPHDEEPPGSTARERVSPSWRTGAGVPLLRAAIMGAPAGAPQQGAPIRRMPRPLALSQVAP
jgi:hypothetical protein